MSATLRANAVLSHLQVAPVAASSTKASASPPSPLVSVVSREGGVAVLQINNPPVNSLHPDVQKGLDAAYREVCQDSAIKAVVITGAGPMFMAGADIAQLQRQQKSRASAAEMREWIDAGDAIFNHLESGPLPTVAAVNGDALGGGCELALSCNARVAADTASFGLPELSLGIIPGLGGTQRLPRVIGLEKAVQLTLTGKKLKAKEALAAGLADAVVKPAELLQAARKVALDLAAGKRKRVKALYRDDRLGSWEDGHAILEMARSQARKKNRLLPQPLAYLDAVEAGLKEGGEKGLQVEADAFARLIGQPVARALVHFFFASRATTKVEGVPAKAKGKAIQKVAVIGGGTMGAGICIAFLSKGYSVVLKEINAVALEAGVGRIVEQVLRVLKSRKMPLGALEVMMRGLTAQTSYDGFDSVDLVIEAAVESIPLKQAIFHELEAVISPTCILSSNTSTIDLEVVGRNTRAQSRIIGLHFFSPAHIMPLLEVIRTRHTSPDVIAQCLSMSKKIGKTPVVVGNVVGFAANRGFFPYGQAAGLLVDCGLSPYRIDAALEAFGMPMGVFKMTDLSGVDIAIHVSATIQSAYGDRTYRSTAVQQLFEQKRLGQKSGKGWYAYAKGKAQPDLPAIQPVLARAAKDAKGLPALQDSAVSEQDIVEMLLFPVVNEFCRLLQEGQVSSAADVDVVSVMGYGFPAFRGGILFWAEDGVEGGFARVAQRLQHFAQTLGANNPQVRAFFQPCDYLQQLSTGRGASQQKKGGAKQH